MQIRALIAYLPRSLVMVRWRHAAPLRVAFTLVELLVALAVMSILFALAVPALQSTMNAMRITDSGNQIAASVERARMHATTTQHVSAIRFYEAADTEAFVAFQTYEIVRDPIDAAAAPVKKPLTKVTKLPEPIVVSTPNSPALLEAEGVQSGTAPVAGLGTLAYREFYIFPNGSSSLSPSSPNPYLTVVAKSDVEGNGSNPQNAFVISIDSLTSRTTVFRR